jgi:hypothetical protein
MIDKRIDYAKAVELFQIAINERGADYVYQRPHAGGGCYYSDHVFDNAGDLTEEMVPYLKPGCAWGLALSRTGLVPLRELAVISGFVADVLMTLGFEITPKAKAFMSESQAAQDAGSAWGQAFEMGVESAELGDWHNGEPRRDTFDN